MKKWFKCLGGEDMKVAYLILAHKNPEQVKRLLNLLNSDVYVHIDKKSNLDEFYIKRNNFFFIKERVDVNWGGFTMVNATLKLINIAKENYNYDFYVLLSGDDYPVKKVEKFEQYLIERKDYSFIEYEKFDEKWQHAESRYKNYWISEKKNIFLKIIQKILNMFINKRAMYKNLKGYKGSQWWCLNAEAIQYVLNYINVNKSIITYFKHTQIPDEMIFQTILLNSPLKYKIKNDNLRHIILKGAHPETLMKKDFQYIKKLQGKFFARKFDIVVDKEILDLLDESMKSESNNLDVLNS